MINNDNNNNIQAFVDDKLVVISVDMALLTNIVGDDSTPFFTDTKRKKHQKNDLIMQ
jgi:hypothetical protein